MEDNLSSSTNDSDYLNSSIGSRSFSIDRPGVWYWFSDYLNKRRTSKKDITDVAVSKSSPSSPGIIGNSLFYLSSTWNPIEMEPELKGTSEIPVGSFEKWSKPCRTETQNAVVTDDDDIQTLSDIEMIGSDGINSEQEDLSEKVSPEVVDYLSSTASFLSDLHGAVAPLVTQPVPIKSNTLKKHLTSKSESEKSEQSYKVRRNRLLQELLSTEIDYVYHLGSVVNGYIASMRDNKPYFVPNDLKGGKAKIIFGNISAIYEWHKDYMEREIRNVVENGGKLGPVFRKWLNKIQIYVAYCQNKSRSDYIVQSYLDNYFEDIRRYLGHQLRLTDLLIKPIQRLTKYQLILSNLLKYTKLAGLQDDIHDIENALKYMQEVPKTTNDMMALTRLAGYEGSVVTQGKLLCHGTLWINEIDDINGFNINQSQTSFYANSPPVYLRSRSVPSSSMKKRYVFLFEKLILVCKEPKKHHAFSEYIYKFHIPTNKISSLKPHVDDDDRKFFLSIEDVSSDGDRVLQLKACTDIKKCEWVKEFQQLINLQLSFIKALTQPIENQ